MEEWDPAIKDFILRCNSCWRTNKNKPIKIIRTSLEKYYWEQCLSMFFFCFFISDIMNILSKYSKRCFRWVISSTIRLNEEDFWIFPDMAKFFNKANIVFAGFDRKSGIHTLMYYISPPPIRAAMVLAVFQAKNLVFLLVVNYIV